MSEKIRSLIFNHPDLIGFFLNIFNHLNPSNCIKGGRHNSFKMGVVLRKKCKIKIEGTNNTIIVEDFSRLINSNIYIHGNNNIISIGPRCYLYKADFYIEDDGCEIRLGTHISIDGATHFAAIEGRKIFVGNDCMFSQNIFVRTGDAHSILDLETRKRINPSKNVSIGNHCWIGMNSTIMKGTRIGDNSIVGAGAILSGDFIDGNCVIAGIPGRIIKSNIDWCRKRI